MTNDSVVCRNCNSGSFYFTGYVEEDAELNEFKVIKSEEGDVLEYECSGCKTKHTVRVLVNKK